MTQIRIDLYSDTKTRPVPEMRRAIAEAVVGDEQHHECPTTTALIERVAALLGQETAMFLPSGTMANEIAVLVHCRPGDEILAHESAHMVNAEGGAPAALAGATTRVLHGSRGLYDAAAVEAAQRVKGSKYEPRSRMLLVEQTANLAGDEVWPLEQMKSVVAKAREHGMAAHMDGARLMNASVKSGIAPAEYASQFDTIYMDFTKGLGCPVGAVLVGKKEFIDQAWFWKQRLGGSMRQAGIVSAAALWALDHHVDRLAEDHDNAALLGAELAKIDGITIEPVSTNIVFWDVAGTGLTALEMLERLKQNGTRAGVHGKTRLRCVTHLDVDRSQILEFIQIVRNIVAKVQA